jgi:hypothetical protein
MQQLRFLQLDLHAVAGEEQRHLIVRLDWTLVRSSARRG